MLRIEPSFAYNGDKNFLKLLGNEDGCREFSQKFYSRVATSKELASLFPGKSLRCASEEFAAFLIQFLDGDQAKSQYRWWLSLRESHARFQITDLQRLAWLSLMDETINVMIDDDTTRQALTQFFRAASGYILGKSEIEIEDSELQERWRLQRVLDELVNDIVCGRDTEAIDRTRAFVTRPSVLVGISARMMEADRPLLIQFVVDNIQANETLKESRFNGRSLLHFAASSACLLVVQILLNREIDPDILDVGKHSPLYRAAGTLRTEAGVLVIRELVQAGASIDHCGGVQRSTPLHEAARHGNVLIIQALLDAGANPEARDKKGLTPFDRAVNCRRQAAADLLALHTR